MRSGVHFWYIVGGLLFLVFALASVAYSNRTQDAVLCSDVRVMVCDSGQHKFVTSSRIEGYLRSQLGEFRGRHLCEINTHEVETLLYGIPAIREAQVFTSGDGAIRMRIHQRTPMFRVLGRGGESCYVDSEGRAFSLDAYYSAHVLVVSGGISLPPDTIAVNAQPGDSFWVDLFGLATYIHEDKVWRALFSQIYVESPDRVELIPRVGGQLIVLGSLKDYEYKLNKLWSIYQAVLPGEGLNAYSEINLMYSNQVVCVRR